MPAGVTAVSAGIYDLSFDVCATDTYNNNEVLCSQYTLRYKDCKGMIAFASGYPVKMKQNGNYIDPVTEGSDHVFEIYIGASNAASTVEF